MIITHQLTFHLDRREDTPTVEAVQGDSAREIALSLFCGGTVWKPPADTQVALRFRKSDGTGGWYDTLPDGTTAYSISVNTVTIRLAPQVTSAAGVAELQVVLRSGGAEIATFTTLLSVQADPSLDTLTSENYTNLSGWIQSEMDQRWESVFNSDGYINSKIDDLHFRCDGAFIAGTISVADGSDAESNAHIRSGFIAHGGRELTVTIPSGVKAFVCFYDKNYGYIGRSDIFYESFRSYFSAAYIRCVAAYADEATVTDVDALANKVALCYRSDSHDAYRGSITALGIKHLSLCKQDGYYQFSAADVDQIGGMPDIACGGILEVRTHGGGDVRQQTIRTTDAQIWFRVNNGAFQRLIPSQEATGTNGATFTPSLSASGDLSWTNDQGLENPPTVNIMGPTGEKGDKGDQGEKGDDGTTPVLTAGTVVTLDPGANASVSITGSTAAPVLRFGIPRGYTPIKGTDYFTEEDQQALVADLKQSLTCETWTFTLEDGSTVEKQVLLN